MYIIQSEISSNVSLIQNHLNIATKQINFTIHAENSSKFLQINISLRKSSISQDIKHKV